MAPFDRDNARLRSKYEAAGQNNKPNYQQLAPCSAKLAGIELELPPSATRPAGGTAHYQLSPQRP